MTFSDSDREFAETISRMAVVSFKNIQMLHVIEEQNRKIVVHQSHHIRRDICGYGATMLDHSKFFHVGIRSICTCPATS